MVQRGDGAGLAFHAFGELGLREFDRDHAVQTRVASSPHLAHTTRADRRHEFVGPDAAAYSPTWHCFSILLGMGSDDSIARPHSSPVGRAILHHIIDKLRAFRDQVVIVIPKFHRKLLGTHADSGHPKPAVQKRNDGEHKRQSSQ